MGWTTEDEVDYLKRIGLHLEKGERPTLRDRIGLLNSYIAAAKMRSDWGEMDRSTVISFARQKKMKLELQVN